VLFSSLACRFRREDRTPLHTIVEQTLPILPPLGTKIFASTPAPAAPERAGHLIYLIMKAYKTSIHPELSPHQQTHQSIVAWGTLLLQVVGRDIAPEAQPEDPEERERFSWWKAKKWAYYIVCFFFRIPRSCRVGLTGFVLIGSLTDSTPVTVLRPIWLRTKRSTFRSPSISKPISLQRSSRST
jgi:hypothetical protein